MSKLGDFLDYISYGFTNPMGDSDKGPRKITAKDVVNGEICFETARHTTQQEYDKLTAKSKPKKGDVLLTKDGTLGRLAVVNSENICINQSVAILRPNEKVDSDFLKYLLSTNYYQRLMIGDASGSTIKHIYITRVDKMEVSIPDLEKQKKIVSILKNIDGKIKLNNKICLELKNSVKELYEYRFIQFDFPDENGNPYKSSGGKMVWNEELKREIPEGWEVKPILDLLSWQGASQPAKENFIYEPKEGYIRFIQNRDYADNSNITYIPEDMSDKRCNKYDIMIDKYGDKTAGTVRFGLEGAYNVALAKIEVLEKNMQEYIRCYFESDTIFNYLHNACMASTRSSLNENNLDFLQLVIPNGKLLENFEKFAKKCIDKRLITTEENRKLIELRDFLLPMLMNGQVTVE